ncbi:MAG: hypothetical protein MZW92_67175 [Comamonadaceae bacterium]|nr:hypothetical protein [Comamonadaceae bacterium]
MVGERTSTLSLSVLAKDLDEGLALFFDVLRNPGVPRGAAEAGQGPLRRTAPPGQRPAVHRPQPGIREAPLRRQRPDLAADQGLLRGHHRGRPQGLPRQVLLAEEHDPGRLRRFLQGRAQGQDRQARRGLDGPGRSPSRRCRKALPVAGAGRLLHPEGHQPGLHQPGPPRPRGHEPGLLRRPGHELHPRRRQLHLADHDQGPLGRGPVLQPGQPASPTAGACRARSPATSRRSRRRSATPSPSSRPSSTASARSR